MKGIIKINNVSDVITNSSSEVFIVKSNSVKDNIKKLISNYHKEHNWYGLYDLKNIPSGLKHILTDEIVEKIKEECDGSSGMGGNCDIWDWKDGYERYKELHNLHDLTVEEWADKLNKPLEELQSVVVVDIDWSCQATINMLRRDFNVIIEGDDSYDNFYYQQFVSMF